MKVFEVSELRRTAEGVGARVFLPSVRRTRLRGVEPECRRSSLWQMGHRLSVHLRQRRRRRTVLPRCPHSFTQALHHAGALRRTDRLLGHLPLGEVQRCVLAGLRRFEHVKRCSRMASTHRRQTSALERARRLALGSRHFPCGHRCDRYWGRTRRPAHRQDLRGV